MIDFIIRNQKIILIGIIGLILGYFINRYANKQSENRIIKELTELIATLKNKRLTEEGKIRLTALNEALEILKNKQ